MACAATTLEADGLICGYCKQNGTEYCELCRTVSDKPGPLPVWRDTLLSGVVPMTNWDEVGEMMPHYTVPLAPIGKPRWSKRELWPRTRTKAWKRWLEWKDAFRLHFASIPLPDHKYVYEVSWRAYFPIPKSWTKKKKKEMAGQPHQQEPDRDNVDKAILDSLYPRALKFNDARVAKGNLVKLWDDGEGPRIELWVRHGSFRHGKDKRKEGCRP